jgi:hypothetical protein
VEVADVGAVDGFVPVPLGVGFDAVHAQRNVSATTSRVERLLDLMMSFPTTASPYAPAGILGAWLGHCG